MGWMSLLDAEGKTQGFTGDEAWDLTAAIIAKALKELDELYQRVAGRFANVHELHAAFNLDSGIEYYVEERKQAAIVEFEKTVALALADLSDKEKDTVIMHAVYGLWLEEQTKNNLPNSDMIDWSINELDNLMDKE